MGMISEIHDEAVANELLAILKQAEVNSISVRIFLANTVYKMYLKYESGKDRASSYKQFVDDGVD